MSQPDISRPRFSYPPLLQSDGAIRLVILQPGTSWTAPALPDSPPQLECRLWSTTVTASRYEVLAYTRGTEERNRTIIVEDAPFNVTERLWDALHRIRADDVRYFWIDVISIDETNLEEKSQARSVHIWFGPHELSSEARQAMETTNQDRNRGRKESHDSLIEYLLHELTDHTYWDRPSVSEELAAANDSNELGVCYGAIYEDCIPWSDFFQRAKNSSCEQKLSKTDAGRKSKKRRKLINIDAASDGNHRQLPSGERQD